MKKRSLIFKKGMAVIAAFGFFGFLYPDLCMLEDTCRVVYEEAFGTEDVPTGSELYYQLLQAKPEEIKIKSRLLELISELFGKG